MRLPGLSPSFWKKSKAESSGDEIANDLKKSVAVEIAPHLLLGQRGERLAAERLEEHGYTLVASNFTLPVGRNLRGALIHAEIDLIAYDGPVLCFVEVKTRASDWFAAPEQN